MIRNRDVRSFVGRAWRIGAALTLSMLPATTGSAQPAKAPPTKGTAAPAAPAKATAAPTTTAAPQTTAAPTTTVAPATTTAPTAAPADSAAPSGPSPDDAGKLFSMGRDAYKADNFAAALDLFRKSYALEATPGTLLNIALAEEKLGKTASALGDFERVVGLLKADDDRMPIAKDGAARVTLRAPRLKIDRAAGAPPTLSIHVDGAPLAANLVGALQPLDPGKHTITTSVYGFEDRSYDVTLTEGQQLTVAVEPGKRTLVAGPQNTASPLAPTSGWTGGQVAGFTLAGVGVGALGVGAVTGILATLKKADIDKTCPDPTKCSAAGMKGVGEAYALSDIATGALIFSGVAAAAGVVVYLVAPGGKSVSVTAAPTTGGAALSATGQF